MGVAIIIGMYISNKYIKIWSTLPYYIIYKLSAYPRIRKTLLNYIFSTQNLYAIFMIYLTTQCWCFYNTHPFWHLAYLRYQTCWYRLSEWMKGVLGHDSALLKLYWAGDNQGEWDDFCYESCPWSRIDRSTCWSAVQCATTVPRMPSRLLGAYMQ